MAFSTGGMLATTGANIGRQVGGAYGQFGKDMGGMMTGALQGFRDRRGAAKAQELLKQFKDNPAQLNALGQKYATEGNDALSKVFFDAAKSATATKEKQVASLEESGQQATKQAQKARAVQVARQKGNADALVALRSGALDPAEYLKSLVKPQEKAKKGQTFASAGRYKDENGNLYAATEVRTRGSGVEIDYSPITPGAPENPVGKLEPVGGAYGETSGEMSDRRVGLAGAETRAEGFAKSQQEAIDNLPKIEVAIGNAERSLELLQQIKTGGFTTAIVRSAQQFFGVEPKNQAEFNLLAGKTVLDNLSNFPGAISEGERQYLEKLYQNLERSGGANQAILEVLLQEAQFYLADTQAKANASSYRDYLETRPTFSSVVPRDNRPKKVNFDDMKDK